MTKILLALTMFVLGAFAQSTAHFSFGKTDAYIISLGKRDAPKDKLIAPDDASKELIKNTSIPQNEHNVMLLKNEKFVALVDTGFPNTTDELAKQMSKLGVKFEDVTHVIITHAHFDHIGGVLDEKGRSNFKNATLMIDKIENDYWLNSSDERAKVAIKSFERVEFFDHSKPLFDTQAKIWARPAYGHTPGHNMISVEHGKEKLLFWADLVHVYEVQMQNPNIAIQYDVDPAMAVKSRLEVLEWLKGEGEYYVSGVHVPFVEPMKFGK